MTDQDPTLTDLTVVAGAGHVALRLHTSHVELQLTPDDAARIARELDAEIRTRGHASLITVELDSRHAIEIDTPTAQRLSIELRHASVASRRHPNRRKSDKERAYIDDTIALSRARTKETAVRVAKKMIEDGQDIDDTLTRLWNAAHNRGWRAGIDDITGD